MDEANRIIRGILDELREGIVPGMTTADIDSLTERRIREAGALPAFKGYPNPGGGRGFPGSACTSVNCEVVHGIPSQKITLREGDIVSVDVGVRYQGYYGDSAETFPVGRIGEGARRLLDVTRRALELGVEQARIGNRVSDIGYAVETHVEQNGFSVVREFVGHGIGTSLHEEPQVPNFGRPGNGKRLERGLVLAIEPMVNEGSAGVTVSAEDGWTARTLDGRLSAHFEVCVAVAENGPRVLGLPAKA